MSWGDKFMNKVHVFFDDDSNTLSYVVSDLESRDAVIIDPVLDFDPASVGTSTKSVEGMIDYIRYNDLTVRMILETHPHADHLSGAQAIKKYYPNAPIAIGEGIREVQKTLSENLNFDSSFAIDGSQFDRLFRDGESVQAGTLTFEVIATPGHTPACSSYKFGHDVFVGDSLFMPDFGTGRCDFPGGCAKTLFRSVKERLYTLPDSTILYSGHDYLPGGRPLRWEAMVGEQKRSNIHIRAETKEEDFVKFRTTRDGTLSAPRLYYPSVQFNIAAGNFPKPEKNGVSYLKFPVNVFKKNKV